MFIRMVGERFGDYRDDGIQGFGLSIDIMNLWYGELERTRGKADREKFLIDNRSSWPSNDRKAVESLLHKATLTWAYESEHSPLNVTRS